MKHTIFNRKIPTVFGIFIIFAGIMITSFVTQRGVPFISRASPAETPQNIQISNITDTSFTVSYTTAASVLGSINYDTSTALKNTAIDASDTNNNLQPKTIHMITAKNLIPQTAYFFSITSGETTFLNNGNPYAVKTGSTLTGTSTTSARIQGTILFPENTQREAIVYITTDNSQTLSGKTDKNSAYSIPLATLRNKTLDDYAKITQDIRINMLISGQNTQSNATILVNQSSPVPAIILGKLYDFTIGESPLATSSGIIGFPSLPASASAIKTPKIIAPQNNESLTDLKPLFKGIASPSANVEIEIHSDEKIKTQVTADKNGAWTFRPTTALSPGAHTITITTRDQLGILKQITESFTVYAAGSQVGQSATPSATLVPSPKKTPTPSPTTTPRAITPTLLPTKIPTPTGMPVVTPTTFAQPITPTPQLIPGAPLLLPFVTTATAIVVVGLSLFFISRGGLL